MEESSFESDNINSLWLRNIFENIKNIEMNQKLAREGCNSILDYLQIPYENRKYVLGDIQYKNLRLIVIEMDLLLQDLEVPIKDKEQLKKFRESLKKLKDIIQRRDLFLKEPKDSSNRIKYSEVTPFFDETLDFLSELKIKIFNNISHLLFAEDSTKVGWQTISKTA